MTNSTIYSNMWARLRQTLNALRQNGPKGLAELFAFTLFFTLGLVTLGACLLAGAGLALYARWQAYKASQAEKEVDSPAAESAGNTNQDPIVAA